MSRPSFWCHTPRDRARGKTFPPSGTFRVTRGPLGGRTVERGVEDAERRRGGLVRVIEDSAVTVERAAAPGVFVVDGERPVSTLDSTPPGQMRILPWRGRILDVR